MSSVCGVPRSPEHIVESHIPSAVQSLHLIAHVFKEQLVFVQVHLQPASKQTKQELRPGRGDHALGKHMVIQEMVTNDDTVILSNALHAELELNP